MHLSCTVFELVSYLFEVADFNLPITCNWRFIGVTLFEFSILAETSGTRKLESLCAIVGHYSCVIPCLAVSTEHRLLTDRQTETR